MTMTTERATQAAHAESKLREWLHEGDRIAIVQTHHTAGGTRSVKFLIPLGNEIVDIAYYIHALQGYRMDPNHGGLQCDDAATVLYHLSRMLFGKPDALSAYTA